MICQYSSYLGFLGNKKIKCNEIVTDNNGRIIVLEAEIDDEIFLLINLYNPNTEAEQVKTLCELEQMLDIFSLDSYKNVFFAGDFNCFFNSNLEASGGNPTLKKFLVSKLYNFLKNTICLISGEHEILFQNAIPLEKIIFQDTYKGVSIIYLFLIHFKSRFNKLAYYYLFAVTTLLF